MHIDTIEWSCFGLSCQWSGDNDSVLCRSTEIGLLWFLAEEPRLAHFRHIYLFGCCRDMDAVLILPTNWEMFSTVSFCRLDSLYLCMYMHIQIHIRNCGQIHFYVSPYNVHKAAGCHTKVLPLSPRAPRVKVRKSHSRQRSTSYAGEQNSLSYRAGWEGMGWDEEQDEKGCRPKP